MREKFNTDLDIDSEIPPNTIFVFAYLQKSLPFRYRFDKLEYPVYFNQKSTVEAFGLDELEIGFRESLLAPEKEESEISDESENITELTSDNVENYDWRNADQKKADQVYILDYKNNDDFIIRLKTKEIREELILAKIPPQKTLLETYTHVRQRIANFKKITFLQERETLQIPIIDIKAAHQFAELGNQRILNKNLSNMLIGQASQTIQFRLDETGATAIFMAKMVVEGISDNIPRHLIFDSPFLLYLKEKKANYPYLIIWIENSELLVEKPIENFKRKQAVFEGLFDLKDH